MIYLLIFMTLWNTALAYFFSWIDSVKIWKHEPILLGDKNIRAIMIYVENVFFVCLAYIASKYFPVAWDIIPFTVPLIFLIALFAQVMFGIVFDTSLNLRRFGFSLKAFLYTSNDGRDLNDALLDRICNKVTNFLFYYPAKWFPRVQFYWLSGVLQWSIKIYVVHIMLKFIFNIY